MSTKLNLFRNFPFVLIFFSGVILLSFPSCNNDDDETMCNLTPLVYNAETSFYGTMLRDNNYWETIIDIESGRFDTIPGTRESGGSINLPVGTKELTDFAGNRRIYSDLNGYNLIVQDLETKEKTTIPLKDPESGAQIIRLQYFNFGKDNNEIYGFSSDRVVYLINLSTQTLTKTERFTIDLDQNNDFLYLKDRNEFLIIGQNNFNGELAQHGYVIYNPDTQETVAQDTFPQRLFGFVKHPETERIYCLTNPTEDQGFRLMELQVGDNGLSLQQLSSADLAIDNLSTYIQTIHTTTNSYICRGGLTSIDNPEAISLFRIDLNTGELIGETILQNYGMMINVKGE